MILEKPGKKNTAKQTDNLLPVRWKNISNKKVIMTNDFGGHVILSEKDLNDYLSGKITSKHRLYPVLQERGFIKTYMDFDLLFRNWKNSNSYLFTGPSLNILVLTLRCNHKCIYCQSQAVGPHNRKKDMSFNTARKAVDNAFKSPSKNIIIEFQGGEPLLNWDVLKKTVEYARNKEKKSDKKLSLALVSNLSCMDEKKADFLMKNEVSICTSLDGPKKLHDENRIFTSSSSHAITVRWIKYFNEKYLTQFRLPYRIFRPSALLTISKKSLSYYREIIDEYVKNQLETIFIRPLSPIGFAKKHWEKIGYSAEEFIHFYRDSLKYIIELNIKGKILYEKTAQILLNKIFNFKDSGFTDMRCPCGAATGQIAYNFNGDVYTCDEGRMVGWEGDLSFKIGNLFENSYEELINSPATKICMYISNLENQPRCSRCPYMPWCGVCPVINYETHSNMWGDNFESSRCKIMMGIFDTIFEFMENKKYSKVLKEWIKNM